MHTLSPDLLSTLPLPAPQILVQRLVERVLQNRIMVEYQTLNLMYLMSHSH